MAIDRESVLEELLQLERELQLKMRLISHREFLERKREFSNLSKVLIDLLDQKMERREPVKGSEVAEYLSALFDVVHFTETE